ncbi:MAG: ATP-dependent zinc metalloprotease FtsH [Clostridia bacterium]|nr:ATP-dependent zinc metalloprotease FtsH [Clostridia bacterium]
MKKAFKSLSFYVILILAVALIVLIVKSFIPLPSMQYGEFLDALREGKLETVTLGSKSCEVTLTEDVEVTRIDTAKNVSKAVTLKKGTRYAVDIVSPSEFQAFMTETIASASSEDKPTFKYNETVSHVPGWVEYVPYLVFGAIMVVFMLMILGQNNGNSKILTFSRSRARLYTDSKVKFDDVAGADEEKEEMGEIVDFLKSPKKYFNMGARIPKGVLLVGPPGTGKTYLAKAVAGEAHVPFFSISGSDFVEMYVGVGAARVRDLFEQAKKNSPCIIFIDEIDAVGRHRGAGLGGGHDEREQTLNQILVEMDGFEQNTGIVIIAATNRPDILDPALTRPGRFDRKITVNYPDIKAREQILGVHSRNKKISEEVDLAEVAKNTAGFTPADLENLMNEAALIAARRSSEEILTSHIKEAVFRVIVGPEKRSHVMTEEEKKLTAYHETGHAIAVKLYSSTDKVDRVSIIPAGMAGGYTAHRPDEDISYYTKKQLFEQIVVALGGRAAEEIMLGDISTGASSDLKSANNIAMSMVATYGMSDALGNMIMNTGSGEVFLGRDYGHTRTVSEELSSLVDREVKKIIDKAYETVTALLKDNRGKLETVAQALIEKERLEGDEFNALMEA